MYDVTNPVRYKLDILWAGEGPLPDNVGIPDLFRPAIDERWLRQGSNVVLGVILDVRSDDTWARLGQFLVDDLLSVGCQVGACLDGQVEWPLILEWTSRVMRGNTPGVVELQWTSQVRPGLPESETTQNAIWCVIQSCAAGRWLRHGWAQLGSGLFNQAADMMVTTYEMDVLRDLTWPQPLSLDSFLATLDRASSWLIPLDDDIGFIVGVPSQSRLSTSLVRD